MKLNGFTLDQAILDILSKQGITALYPPQQEALPHALNGENLVLSIPTASGKSLVAYLTIINRLLQDGGKALYVVPLRALAREKYEDLKMFTDLGLKVALATGDLDESDPHLSRYNIIVCTSEKADSLLRHGLNWLSQIKVLVVDELHLIHDPGRGPTLEVIISRFKALNPETQILALSATIKNAVELADWLGGKLISSDWRPVPLKEGVFYHDEIKYNDGSVRKINVSSRKVLDWLVEDSVSDGGQVLVFVNNRRSTVSLAKQLSLSVNTLLSDDEKKGIQKVLYSLKHGQRETTSIGEILISCMGQGVAFHHAGLDGMQRRTIEQGFKTGVIKCIVATPTLAAGVNIPARRVIIRDLWRYAGSLGMRPIPILEYKQQAGRAGRPQYDDAGEALTIAKTQDQQERIFYEYILGDTEAIYSKLGNQAALRMHLLAALATRFVEDDEGINRFIESTFFAYQSDIASWHDEIEMAVDFLMKHEFIEEHNGTYSATLFGMRTSSLYIDPLSAMQLRTALETADMKKVTSLSFLHAVCATPDVRSLYLRARDDWVEERVDRLQGVFLLGPQMKGGEEYEWFLSDVKTALLLEDWISEIPEDGLVSRYDIGPGDIHGLVESAEWLLHAAREFARMYNFAFVSELNDLIIRVHNGCKKELLNLIALRGIGRVRARALFNEGFKTVNDLRDIPVERIARIKTIGKRVATSIKHQIGEGDKLENKELDSYSIR